MPEEQSIRLTVCGVTDVGVVRDHNEDAFAVVNAMSGAVIEGARPRTVDTAKEPLLLAVADGMGGENAGEVASALTIETLRAVLARAFLRTDRIGSLRSAFEHTHVAVTNAAASPGHEGMGATLVAALVDGTRATIAWVGDARAYLYSEGSLSQLTKDQSLLQRLIDGGQIDPARIADFPHKNVILQAIGRSPTPVLDVPTCEVAFKHGDVLLLCSDGLSSELSDDDIRALLAAGGPLDIAAARLVAHANERGGNDNVTVVIAAAG
jgi:serine/threonine protein phosphatase PrpC